jgi:Ankyrin repeats (3 copies)
MDNPQNYLDYIMKSHGYSTKRYNTLRTAYHNKPTALQKASYDLHLIGIVKGSDATNLDDILKAGISPNPCNTYGESLVHMVCRRGDEKLLQVMIQNGCNVQVADDYGRTPLHDACWAANPAFDTVEMLLERDLTLLQMTDCRGFLPLSYVRKDQWPAWIDFFDRKKHLYFPNLLSTTVHYDDDIKSTHSTVSTVSEFVDQDPNSRPLPDPVNALPLDLANMVASGTMKPEEAILLRNKRLATTCTKKVQPKVIDETKELEDDDDSESGDDDSDEDDSDDYDSEDDSDYDSEDDDDSDDLTDAEMEELMGVLSIQLRGAQSSGMGIPAVGVTKV